MTDLCDIASIYNKNGIIEPKVKKNFGQLKDSYINCLFKGKYKFIEDHFPKFINDSVEQIIDKICMFIENSNKFYVDFQKRSNKNILNEYGFIINKNNLLDFYFYISAGCGLDDENRDMSINIQARQTTNFIINNYPTNKIKNYILHATILDLKKLHPKKYKNIKNFKELYQKFDINKWYKISGEILKEAKLQLKQDKEIFINDFFSSFNGKINMKTLPNSINYYLQFVSKFYNKYQIKKEVERKLKEKKIKYSL